MNNAHVLVAVLVLGISINIMATSPIEELNSFENNLNNILTDLHNQNGTKIVASPELINTLQNDWDTMIQQQAGERIRHGNVIVPVNKDVIYIRLRNQIHQKLNITLSALKEKLKK